MAPLGGLLRSSHPGTSRCRWRGHPHHQWRTTARSPQGCAACVPYRSPSKLNPNISSGPSKRGQANIFDWVFGPSGEIEIRIGATGIDAVKALAGRGNAPEGNRVTPDLVAVFHDHFFSLRLDLDIDGPHNRLVREDIAVEASRDNPLSRSYWRMDTRLIDVERPLQAKASTVWRVESSARLGEFRDATGYQVMPEGTTSLLALDDSPQRRGAFSAAPMWVTRYEPGERAASGDYPNQHPGGTGLPTFADGERLADADLVLWPTIGFRHVTRVEDWPALSTIWKSVRLRPYGFFARNPSIRPE